MTLNYDSFSANRTLHEKKILTEVSDINQIVDALNTSPVVIFKGGKSLDIIENVAALFGGAKENPTFADIRDIKINPAAKNSSIALSSEAHPPHTDGTFSKKQLTIFMLQCVEEDELGGGNGLYWGVDALLTQMPLLYKEFLFENEVIYSRLREDGINTDSYCGPILFSYQGNVSIRWRFDSQVRPKLARKLPPAEEIIFEESIAWVLNYLTTEPPVEVNYTVGDIVICDNLRALHGRRTLKGSNRHFRRVWLELI